MVRHVGSEEFFCFFSLHSPCARGWWRSCCGTTRGKWGRKRGIHVYSTVLRWWYYHWYAYSFLPKPTKFSARASLNACRSAVLWSWSTECFINDRYWSTESQWSWSLHCLCLGVCSCVFKPIPCGTRSNWGGMWPSEFCTALRWLQRWGVGAIFDFRVPFPLSPLLFAGSSVRYTFLYSLLFFSLVARPLRGSYCLLRSWTSYVLFLSCSCCRTMEKYAAIRLLVKETIQG